MLPKCRLGRLTDHVTDLARGHPNCRQRLDPAAFLIGYDSFLPWHFFRPDSFFLGERIKPILTVILTVMQCGRA
jgi:hypothetical protein